MKIKIRFSFLLTMFLFVVIIPPSTKFSASPPIKKQEKIRKANRNQTPIDQVKLACNLFLEFAQMGFDLINVKKILKAELDKTQEGKSFSPSRLLTTRQWTYVKKIEGLEESFETQFIKALFDSHSKFLDLDSIDKQTFKKEIIALEIKISDFCHYVELSIPNKIGEEGSIQDILENIHNMVSKLKTAAHDSSRNITNLVKIKNLFWGTAFSYEVLPELLLFGIGITKLGLFFSASYRNWISKLLLKVSRSINKYNIAYDIAYDIKDLSEIINEPGYKTIVSLVFGIIMEGITKPIIAFDKALQTDAYNAYCQRRDLEIKHRLNQFKKTVEKNIFFDDIIGCEKEKKEAEQIVEALSNPLRFKRFGAEIPKGLFLVGPPGSGKTLIAKAIAAESNCPCWTVCGSELFEDDEKTVTQKIDELFCFAEMSAPAIVVIDEIDFVGSRESESDKICSDKAKVLAKLLTKLSGFESPNPYRPILIIATANHIENIDPALLRSGRFDVHISLGLPDSSARKTMFERQLGPISHTLDLDLLAELSVNCSFADIANITNMARLMAGSRLEKVPSLEEFKTAIEKSKIYKE